MPNHPHFPSLGVLEKQKTNVNEDIQGTHIRSITDQLPKKNFLVGIEGVDNKRHELGNFCLEGKCLHLLLLGLINMVYTAQLLVLSSTSLYLNIFSGHQSPLCPGTWQDDRAEDFPFPGKSPQ